MFVAGARAVAGVDDVAERLLPLPARGALAAARRSIAARRLLRVASLGLVDHLAVRTGAIDDVVAGAARDGARALVILGAGLDARAFRMDALADTTVFEVDHPSSQAYKRALVASLRPKAREIRYVGVDFERDRLAERLDDLGHDPRAPTTWLWEGVTPYLTRPAIEATLDVVAARSPAPTGGAPAPAPTTLAMTYVTGELGSIPRPLRPIVIPAFRALGEPIRALFTPDEARELVSTRGFEVVADHGMADLAARYGASARSGFDIAERLLVARARFTSRR